jgi:hypothetical protein
MKEKTDAVTELMLHGNLAGTGRCRQFLIECFLLVILVLGGAVVGLLVVVAIVPAILLVMILAGYCRLLRRGVDCPMASEK